MTGLRIAVRGVGLCGSWVLTAGFLSACGGGGGSATSVPSDTTAPTVASVTPAQQAGGVLVTASVSATFSEPVDCAKAVSDALVITHAGSALPGSLSCAGSTWSFKPSADLPTNATIVATVSPGVADLAGNRLGTAFTWQFNLPAWTVHLGSAGADAFVAVQADGAGNLFVAGRTAGSFDAANPNGGALLVKYDARGAQQWIRQIGVRPDSAQALALDADGNVFVGGRADKDPVDSPGFSSSVFIAKYDRNGNQIWLKKFGSQQPDFLRALRADAGGNVVAVGYTGGDLFGRFAGGSSDFFVMKLDSAGSFLWGRQDGGPGSDNAGDLVITAGGDIFIAGYTSSTLDGLTPSGSTDAFLMKYSANGKRQWTRLVGTPAADYAEAVRLDSTGDLYMLGRTAGTFAGQSSAGGLDGFVARFNAAGTVQWVRQFGTTADDYPNAMALDASGGLRVAGFTNGTFPGASLVGGFDAFVLRMDANVVIQWARQWGGAGDDYVFGLAVDASGNAFVPSMGGMSSIVGAGDSDGFLLKITADGTPR